MNIVYYLISFLLLLSMSFSIQGNSQNETYIFYFDVNDKNMHKYYAYKNGPLKFLYDLDNTENVIFQAKEKINRNEPNRIEILPKDTVNLNIKNRDWLNELTWQEKYNFFWNQPEKTIHILEKDSSNAKIYMIRDMIFTEEIE